MKKITRDIANNIANRLIQEGYVSEYNRFCPFSLFFTKRGDGDIIHFVRMDTLLGRNGLDSGKRMFETWDRHNDLSVFDKNLDTKHRKYSFIVQVDLNTYALINQ